ncbi:hypothetical protein VTI28DRAFT_9063 [Corynascus sepedonium]
MGRDKRNEISKSCYTPVLLDLRFLTYRRATGATRAGRRCDSLFDLAVALVGYCECVLRRKPVGVVQVLSYEWRRPARVVR